MRFIGNPAGLMKAQQAPTISMITNGKKLTCSCCAIDRAPGNMKAAAAALVKMLVVISGACKTHCPFLQDPAFEVPSCRKRQLQNGRNRSELASESDSSPGRVGFELPFIVTMNDYKLCNNQRYTQEQSRGER